MDKITIEGTQVSATSPEGKTATMSLEQLMARAAPKRMDSNGVVLPDGIKLPLSEGAVTILVHETPPGVYSLRWIASDSSARFGSEAKYRQVAIALPYVILLAVFAQTARGGLQLTASSECFFRNAPLAAPEDELFYPALLNCSKFASPDGHPLSWLCVQKLDMAKLVRERDLNKRIQASIHALLHCLFETGFNYSSEHHEGSSWYTESRKVDKRIATIEAWETATKEDPLFALELSWLKTGYSVRQVADRIFQNLRAGPQCVTSASDLARIVFNNNGDSPKERAILGLFAQLGL